MRSYIVTVTGFCLIAAGCHTPAEKVSTSQRVATAGGGAGTEADGEHLAITLCSGCHAVADGEISPNAEAPGFVSIANREGLTRETLGNFLHDSYNFPNQMNLELSDEDSEAISAYILTLRDAGN